ncbi:hypothetical protein AVEN_36983-1 [Araneus ventricosus]|uniref:Uncharacterized protein n=1 Tax=Araneus ventricosus TaxID=182803 RepID=A0A4Y2LHU6_ARAVE|nr:hypothetical protein AVEN_36983-1 [Araneus ventricosus]
MTMLLCVQVCSNKAWQDRGAKAIRRRDDSAGDQTRDHGSLKALIDSNTMRGAGQFQSNEAWIRWTMDSIYLCRKSASRGDINVERNLLQVVERNAPG